MTNGTGGNPDDENLTDEQTAAEVVGFDGGSEEKPQDYQGTDTPDPREDNGGAPNTWPEDGEEPQDVEAERVRQANRDHERGPVQKMKDSLDNMYSAVTGANETKTQRSADLSVNIADVEQDFYEAQELIVNEAAKSRDVNAEKKEEIVDMAQEEDERIAGDTEVREQREQQFIGSIYGSDEVEEGAFEEHVFGTLSSIVNANFLRDNGVKMRDIEGSAYTQTEEGSNMPFVDEAKFKGDNADQWLQFFNTNLDRAEASLEDYIDSFNLEERLDAYEEAMEFYNTTSIIKDTLEDLAEVEDVAVEQVNERLEDLEDLSTDSYQSILNAVFTAGPELNGRPDYWDQFDGSIELEPEEREKATELAYQARARAVDRAKLHKDRLDEAVGELRSFKEEFSDTREKLSEYSEELEDLTRIDGVGEQTADVLYSIDGVDTIVDIALRGEKNIVQNPSYLKEKERRDGNASLDEGEIVQGARDALEEIAEEYDEVAADEEAEIDEQQERFGLNLEPTSVIESDGEDYSGIDQVYRKMDSVYQSSRRLERMFSALEGKIPELDRYEDPEWTGEEDTIEEERDSVYQDLGIDEPASAEDALAFDSWTQGNNQEDYEEE